MMTPFDVPSGSLMVAILCNDVGVTIFESNEPSMDMCKFQDGPGTTEWGKMKEIFHEGWFINLYISFFPTTT